MTDKETCCEEDVLSVTEITLKSSAVHSHSLKKCMHLRTRKYGGTNYWFMSCLWKVPSWVKYVLSLHVMDQTKVLKEKPKFYMWFFVTSEALNREYRHMAISGIICSERCKFSLENKKDSGVTSSSSEQYLQSNIYKQEEISTKQYLKNIKSLYLYRDDS